MSDHPTVLTVTLIHCSRSWNKTQSCHYSRKQLRKCHFQIWDSAMESSWLQKIGNRRPVIDLSTLNWLLLSPHFHMETTSSVMQAMLLSTWSTSIDLKMHVFIWLLSPRTTGTFCTSGLPLDTSSSGRYLSASPLHITSSLS